MPKPSSRISGISPSGKDGWEVHFAALSRRQQGEDILMLSVGDHDFDTPSETVEACVKAVRSGHHHYTQLPGLPRLREAMARIATEATGNASRMPRKPNSSPPASTAKITATGCRPILSPTSLGTST